MNLINVANDTDNGCAIDLLADILDDFSEESTKENKSNDSSFGHTQKQNRSLTFVDITAKAESAQEKEDIDEIKSYRNSLKFIREVSGACDEEDEEDRVFGTSNNDHHTRDPISFKDKRLNSWKNKTLSAPPSQQTTKHVNVDTMFGMRIINPLVSSRIVEQLMQGRKFISVAQARQISPDKEPSIDWVVVGAIVNKSQPRTSKSGSSYTVWRISDLKPSLLTVSVFLFGAAYSTHWKHPLGTVIGILNPKLMAGREGYSNNETSLSVSHAEKLLVVGSSKDYALCQARKKDGSPCTSFVNAHDSKVCVHHLASEYKKTSRNFVSPSTSRINLQNKILGKHEVFYAGKSYVKTPAKPNPKQVTHDKLVLSRLNGNNGVVGNASTPRPNNMPASHPETLRTPVTANRLRNMQANKDSAILERLSAASDSHEKTSSKMCSNVKTKNGLDEKDKPSITNRIEENTPSIVMKERIRTCSQKEKNKNTSVLKEKTVMDSIDPTIYQKKCEKGVHKSYYLEVEDSVSLKKQIDGYDRKDNSRRIGPTGGPVPNPNGSFTKQEVAPSIHFNNHSSAETKTKELSERTGTRDTVKENTPSFVMRSRTKSIKGDDHSKTATCNSNLSPNTDSSQAKKNSLEMRTLPANKRTEYFLELEEDQNSLMHRKSLELAENTPKIFGGRSLGASPSPTAFHPRKQQARAKAAQIIKKLGPLPKDDTKSLIAAKRKREGQSEAESEKDRISQMEKFRRLMSVGSKHTTLVEARDLEAQEEYFSNLEKKEQLEEKMLTTYKVPCKAVRCSKCKYLALQSSEFCRSQGHRVSVVETFKRFFKCEECGNRTISLNLVPTHTCGRCNSSRWTRTAMISEKRGPNLTTPLCLRGGEELFLGHQTEGNINLLVPEDR